MQPSTERQDRAEAILDALDDDEQRELSEEATRDEQRAQRIKAALEQGSVGPPDA